MDKPRARLRMIGLIVLLLGISGAWIVYWTGARSPDLMDDPLMTGYSRSESRQVEILIGKMGLMMVNLIDSLKRPKIQAIIIAAASILISVGCFYFAELQDDGADV